MRWATGSRRCSGDDPQRNARTDSRRIEHRLGRANRRQPSCSLNDWYCSAWPATPTWCWTCIATSKPLRTCTPTPEAWPRVEPLARYCRLRKPTCWPPTPAGSLSIEVLHPGLVAVAATFCRTLSDSHGQLFGNRRTARPGDVNHGLASLDCQAIIDYLIHFGANCRRPSTVPDLAYPATPLAASSRGDPGGRPVGVQRSAQVNTWKPGN